MKTTLATLSFTLLAALAPSAQALSHLWNTVDPSSICLRAIAPEPAGLDVYVLTCDSHTNGWLVKHRSVTGTYSDTGGAAVAITMSADGILWAVNNLSQVWTYNGSTWTQLVGGKCEGGNLLVKQPGTSGDTVIAVGSSTNAFVIAGDGETAFGNDIRRWTGSCWQIMPGNGKAREIAMFSGNTPWVVNTQDTIFIWAGTAWSSALPGAAVAIGKDGIVVGNDNQSVFLWNGSTWSSNGAISPAAIQIASFDWGLSSDGRLVRHIMF